MTSTTTTSSTSPATRHEALDAIPGRWRLVLQAEGNGPPAVCRIRRALKWLLRTHGLRCVEATELHDSRAKPVKSCSRAIRESDGSFRRY